MNNEPLVTYIVASYNHSAYVQSAIESIINQNYSNIQLIVIDDGSTDDSFELLTRLKERYNFDLFFQKNSGVVVSINRGVSLAKGSYIVPHASDDISHPDRTAAQVKVLTDNPKSGFTVGAIRKISADGKILSDWPDSSVIIFDFDDFSHRRASVNSVACMYRTDAIKKVCPLDEEIPFEDVQLNWLVSDLGLTCIVDNSVKAVDYRVLPNSHGRRNRELHHHGFLRFLSRYENRYFYANARSKAMAALFSEIAEVDKVRALKFIFSNIPNVRFSHSIKGFIKLLFPNSLINKFKKKF